MYTYIKSITLKYLWCTLINGDSYSACAWYFQGEDMLFSFVVKNSAIRIIVKMEYVLKKLNA